MKHLLIILISVFSSLGLAQYSDYTYSEETANGITLDASLFYIGDTAQLSSDRTRSDTLLSGSLGYKFNNWFFGATYDSDTEKNTIKNASGGNGDYQWQRVAYGPTVGYHWGSWSFWASYFLKSTLEVQSPGSNPTTYDGFGLQISSAYMFPIFSHIQIGPEVAWRSFTYSKSEINNVSTDLVTNYSRAMIDVFFNMRFSF